MFRKFQLIFVATFFLMFSTVLVADECSQVIRPYVQTYCAECHNSEVHKGELDLTRYGSDADVSGHFRRWNNITEFIRNGEMPPEDAKKQPTIDESNSVLAAVEEISLAEAVKNAGDPGIVLPRRLSNTEFDAAVRDLTGIDIRPTKDFPVDPAGGEGFDNTGEALRTSPNLVKKHLAASQLVADHLVLKPDGISFAPFPVTSYNERKKLTEQAVIDFYESHAVDTLHHLEAAWRCQYRGNEHRQLSIDEWLNVRRSETPRISAKYLTLVWQTLGEAGDHTGFLKEIGEAWKQLPAPKNDSDRPIELGKLKDTIEFHRRVLSPTDLQLIKASAGNWPISHLDYRSKIADGRDEFDRSSFRHESLLNVDRVQEPKGDKAEAYSVFVHVDSAFAEGDNYVIVKQPFFSRSARLSHNDDDAKKQEVQSLRSVLEKHNPALVATLGFGKHATDDIDENSFVVKAPGVIEIPLTVEMQKELSGKHLMLPCHLDTKLSHEGSVFLRRAVGQSSSNIFGGNPQHLIFADSKTVDRVAQSAGTFFNSFPNDFFYVDRTRGLAAGFHLVEGFFRDDQPLVQKVLTDQENAELNQLWSELHFVTNSAEDS